MRMLIIIGTIVATVATGSVAAGIVSYNSCGYDTETGNYLYDNNKVSAYGTMDNALECALQGMLPEVVANRLGIYGDEETQIEGMRIYYINKQKKEVKEN